MKGAKRVIREKRNKELVNDSFVQVAGTRGYKERLRPRITRYYGLIVRPLTVILSIVIALLAIEFSHLGTDFLEYATYHENLERYGPEFANSFLYSPALTALFSLFWFMPLNYIIAFMSVILVDYSVRLSYKLSISCFVTVFSLLSIILVDYFFNALQQGIAMLLVLISIYYYSSSKKISIPIYAAATIFHPVVILYVLFVKPLNRLVEKFRLLILLVSLLFVVIFLIEKASPVLQLLQSIHGKFVYYLTHSKGSESDVSLIVKSAIVIYIYLSRKKYSSQMNSALSVYIVIYLFYVMFLQVDILSNRIFVLARVIEPFFLGAIWKYGNVIDRSIVILIVMAYFGITMQGVV